MRWQYQMRQQRLRFRRRQPADFADDALRPERSQRIELEAARGFGAAVGEVADLVFRRSLDRRVRGVDKARDALRQPLVAPRLPARPVHALLHDRPMAVVGDDEAVQVEVEPILNRSAVDLGDEPGGGLVGITDREDLDAWNSASPPPA